MLQLQKEIEDLDLCLIVSHSHSDYSADPLYIVMSGDGQPELWFSFWPGQVDKARAKVREWERRMDNENHSRIVQGPQ